MEFSKEALLQSLRDTNFRKSFFDQEGYEESILTHYVHNKDYYKNNDSMKNEALALVKKLLSYTYPEKSVSLEVAEAVMNYGLFDFEAPFLPQPSPEFTFIDLFAGVGGFRLALQNIGGKCMYSSEWDFGAKKTYECNFGEIPFGDITEKRVKNYIPDNFDILCAGFPCQAFSIAGYRKGFDDSRGNLFFDIEEIAEKHKPKVIFLENVKNLVAHDKGHTFQVILNSLEHKLGYKVYYQVLNSMTHANVPQNRERIFIVAFDPLQVPNYRKFSFPNEIPLTKSIHDFLEVGKQDQKFYYSKDHIYYSELEKTITRKDTIYQWRRVYVRENKSCVCPTLTANMGTGGHNVPLIKDDFGIRKLTPKECFAFQGYPIERFILPSIANSKLYMQAGNSVTTTLIERISCKIKEVL